MNRARDHRSGPAYEQWKLDRQKEIEAEPEFQFKQAANAEAEANRKGVLTTRLNDEYMATFGKIVRPPFREDLVSYAMDKFKEQTDYVRSRKNAIMLVEFIERNNLSPADIGSYLIAHAILKLWNCYPDEVAPVEVAPVVVDTRTPSETAEAKYKARMTEIVVYDPMDNRGYTEFDLEHKVDAKTERRLRRLMEGKHGNNLYDVYLEIKDIQHQQAIALAQKLQEEQQ